MQEPFSGRRKYQKTTWRQRWVNKEKMMINSFQFDGGQKCECRQPTITEVCDGDSKNIWEKLFKQNSLCVCSEDRMANDANVWEKCMNVADIFAKALRLGRIRGIVILFTEGPGLPSEPMYVQLTRELLKGDILVVACNCAYKTINTVGSSVQGLTGDGLAEFCDYLDIVPVMELDGFQDLMQFERFCAQISIHSEVGFELLPAAILMHKWSTRAMDSISLYDANGNNVFAGEGDYKRATDLIDMHIHEKRLSMSWCDRYHCSIFS